MKLYRVTIIPTSNFATTLKGDTLFGQICWAIFYKFGKEKLAKLLDDYKEDKKPFLVVSDAFPKGYLPKPKMPSRFLDEKSEDKKLNRKKLWLTLDELMSGAYSKARRDKEVNSSDKSSVNIHNALNYKTFHTGDGFDPHGLTVTYLGEKDIYFLVDENQLSLDEFKEAFKLLSEMGYGKKATIGKGRFEYDENKIELIEIDNHSNSFMSLSPFSPKGLEVKNIYYEPFTRFGKFGATRAYKNAFKKPILLADVASVIEFKESKSCKYLGRAISGLSDISEYKDTVHQGYSIVLPLKELSYD
ncbi:CRISPR-associated RAMP protein, Csm4 family [hydrothermal vent metagenome]|uniref:CRISPR system Cms protein Csm4 n=1 Tax=hydrothermal vent metagenome TaxID=652676 RepID=A0A1W1CTK0_9ZZZZ